jgi:hypothetical protein
MSRRFRDGNLLEWEAYPTSGPHGFAQPARIIFHCLTDRSLRARSVAQEGDAAGAAALVRRLGEAELAAMLKSAQPLN